MKKENNIVSNIIWGATLAASFAFANKVRDWSENYINKRLSEVELIEEVEIVEES